MVFYVPVKMLTLVLVYAGIFCVLAVCMIVFDRMMKKKIAIAEQRVKESKKKQKKSSSQI